MLKSCLLLAANRLLLLRVRFLRREQRREGEAQPKTQLELRSDVEDPIASSEEDIC